MMEVSSEQYCNSNRRESSLSISIQGSAETVWKEAKDFGGLKKWYPSLEFCEIVEGENNTVGCIRLCRSADVWAKEKLLSLDDRNMTYTYCITDSNFGLQSYVVSITVSPTTAATGTSLMEEDEEEKQQSQRIKQYCTVTWKLEIEALPQVDCDEIVAYIHSCFQQMAKGLELLATSAS